MKDAPSSIILLGRAFLISAAVSTVIVSCFCTPRTAETVLWVGYGCIALYLLTYVDRVFPDRPVDR